jgi:hypothetical protein
MIQGLQLHENGVLAGRYEAVLMRGLSSREFADDHGDFVACVAAGTVDTVL